MGERTSREELIARLSSMLEDYEGDESSSDFCGPPDRGHSILWSAA